MNHGSLRLLGGGMLGGQRLLRHHRRPSRVAHPPRMRGQSLTGHLHGLLGHVCDWRLSGVVVRGHLWHGAPRHVDHMRL